MEVPGATKSMASIAAVLLYECIGTACLLIVVNWSANGGAQPFAVGVLIFCMIVQLGDVTGGHFNPAVTLGVYIKQAQRGISKLGSNGLLMVMIIVAQIIGGTIGILVVHLSLAKIEIQGTDESYLDPTIAILCPPALPGKSLCESSDLNG